MNQHDLMTKWNDLKIVLKNRWSEKVHQLFKNQLIHHQAKPSDDHDHYVDDLPLTLNRDPSPGIKYYPTENSSFASGAEKEIPRQRDSFGERDTFDFEEADDFQTNRDRKQNSDLPMRFYTNGMDLEEFND